MDRLIAATASVQSCRCTRNLEGFEELDALVRIEAVAADVMEETTA